MGRQGEGEGCCACCCWWLFILLVIGVIHLMAVQIATFDGLPPPACQHFASLRCVSMDVESCLDECWPPATYVSRSKVANLVKIGLLFLFEKWLDSNIKDEQWKKEKEEWDLLYYETATLGTIASSDHKHLISCVIACKQVPKQQPQQAPVGSLTNGDIAINENNKLNTKQQEECVLLEEQGKGAVTAEDYPKYLLFCTLLYLLYYVVISTSIDFFPLI